jgi:Ca2+-binding RTX toxin-like protein
MKTFTKNLFAKKSTKPARKSRQLTLEMLEDRVVLDATSSFLPAYGVIQIQGTNLSDHARVIQEGGTVWVYTQTSTLPGAWKSYDASQARQINFYGYEGNDVFFNETGINSFSALGSGDDIFFAGHGNDTVLCGTGDDMGTGGLGNDSILGEAGNDVLRGFMGNDTISGGDGWDELYGEWGNDLLFGGAGDSNDPHGHDQLYGGDGSDVLEAGFNNIRVDNIEYASSDTLFGNDSESYGYVDRFIPSNGRYAPNGDFYYYDVVADNRAEDVVCGFGRFRSAEAEYQQMGRIPGVLDVALEENDWSLPEINTNYFMPEIDPAAMVSFLDTAPDTVLPEDLLASVSADYSISQDPALVELGPEVEEGPSIFDTLASTQPLDYTEAVELPVSMFEQSDALTEGDLTAMTEIDDVFFASQSDLTAIDVSDATLAPLSSCSYTSYTAIQINSYALWSW